MTTTRAIRERLPAADPIRRRLWQGAHPETGGLLAELGFTMVVLCARELQLPAEEYPGVQVVWAPNRDCERMTPEEWTTARDAAREVAREYRRGGRILVACRAGMNRSGLVVALALWRLFRKRSTMQELIDRVQDKHLGALCNSSFVERLLRHAHPRKPRREEASYLDDEEDDWSAEKIDRLLY